MTPIHGGRDARDTREMLMVITERVTNVQKEVGELAVAVEKMALGISHIEDMERRLSALEDSQTWVTRVVLGLVVTAVVGLVLVSSGDGTLINNLVGR
jgi:hypothetical protein